MTAIIRQRFTVAFDFPVVFTRQAFAPENTVLADCLRAAGDGPHELAVVLDAGAVTAAPGLPGAIEAYAVRHAGLMTLAAPPCVVPGGEAAKTGTALADRVLELIFTARLCRQSFLLVCGGGAVLDAAGFAAATAHRGVRLVRMPSTVLAQNDAGVGVKNGINRFGRKNFQGTFAPPFAVVNDLDLLAGLPERERRAGLAEAVKVALIRDASFFARLTELAPRLAGLDPAAVEEAVARCAELHLEHIATGGDPFELGSARPLDFGHWSAHALEEAAGGALPHGEAVAVGVALDTVYSRLAGLLPEEAEARVLTLLLALKLPIWHPGLANLDVEAALESFREHLGGELTISLLTGLGSRLEVNKVDAGLMRQAIGRLKARGA